MNLKYSIKLIGLHLTMFALFLATTIQAQVVINEGCNRNFSTLADEDSDYEDWIELYNAGSAEVDLFGYSLTDDVAVPNKWVMPHVLLPAGGFLTIYCSDKDRYETTPFTFLSNSGPFIPESGWNSHVFSEPYFWDGTSNLLVNVCSYSSLGYITNSVFNQTDVGYNASLSNFQDGSPAACGAFTGGLSTLRPNMKLNETTVGTGTEQNCNTCYPAPYGNWYWGARHEFLIRASELTASGLVAGNIDSLSFDVVSTDPVNYDYIEISLNTVPVDELSEVFYPIAGFKYHTNFKLSSSGETVYLYAPDQTLVSSLLVDVLATDLSVGSLPDGSAAIANFYPPTPSETNNLSTGYTEFATEPTFSIASGFFSAPISVSIDNPNAVGSMVYYTLDGNDPTTETTLYTGQPIAISASTVIRARAYETGKIPSKVSVVSYFFNVDHVTPIISITTDPENLYGALGIFDNWSLDWLRNAYVEYFDSMATHLFVFGQNAGLKIDGGAGGSRYLPQHSMRVEFNNSLVGDGPIDHLVIPDRPNRTKYSDFYLRNGSNQYLILPYKEACAVKMMCSDNYNYYSAWRPVSVYINGGYFGLYELREKYNTEYFKEHDGATKSTTDILSVSYFNGGYLRAIEGSVDTFYSYYDAFNTIPTSSPTFWEQTDQYFDLTNYTDYVIGESWIANNDWPYNNIKIYRSDSTNYRYRFALIDPELGLQPNGWTDCNSDQMDYLINYDQNYPYIHIWQRGLQNNRFRDYFINRYADMMNTNYKVDRLLAIENSFYQQTVQEMPNEYARWGDPNNIQGQMTDFYNNHITYRNELSCRTDKVRNHIQNAFDLPQQVNVTLNVVPFDGGSIKISTVTPESYPWQGLYFDGLPINITASANDGFLFSHWIPNELVADTLNPFYNDTLDISSPSFTAVFTAISQVNDIAQNDVSIYPTPAAKTLFIDIKNPALQHTGRYQILDVNGKVLAEAPLNSTQSITNIDVSALPPAVYVIVIQLQGAAPISRRFVKI